jgi:hypothetical protein|tara:strand:+ start:223 stop:522 length:300 start_codon:yes stop_codon:yes gene_type:complete
MRTTETIRLNTNQVIDVLNSYLNAGARLHYFNGAQWYIALGEYGVAVIDSSLRENCTLEFMSGQKAYDYLKTSSNCTEDNAFANSLELFVKLVTKKVGV